MGGLGVARALRGLAFFRASSRSSGFGRSLGFVRRRDCAADPDATTGLPRRPERPDDLSCFLPAFMPVPLQRSPTRRLHTIRPAVRHDQVVGGAGSPGTPRSVFPGSPMFNWSRSLLLVGRSPQYDELFGAQRTSTLHRHDVAARYPTACGQLSKMEPCRFSRFAGLPDDQSPE